MAKTEAPVLDTGGAASSPALPSFSAAFDQAPANHDSGTRQDDANFEHQGYFDPTAPIQEESPDFDAASEDDADATERDLDAEGYTLADNEEGGDLNAGDGQGDEKLPWHKDPRWQAFQAKQARLAELEAFEAQVSPFLPYVQEARQAGYQSYAEIQAQHEQAQAEANAERDFADFEQRIRADAEETASYDPALAERLVQSELRAKRLEQAAERQERAAAQAQRMNEQMQAQQTAFNTERAIFAFVEKDDFAKSFSKDEKGVPLVARMAWQEYLANPSMTAEQVQQSAERHAAELKKAMGITSQKAQVDAAKKRAAAKGAPQMQNGQGRNAPPAAPPQGQGAMKRFTNALRPFTSVTDKTGRL